MALLLRSIFGRENVAESKPTDKKFDPLGILECRGDHLGGGEGKRKENNGNDNRIVRRECSVGDSAAAWSDLLPELLGEIMRRVEADGEQWPQRQSVVACGGVCKQWKEAIQEAVEMSSLRQPGIITHPSSLKQPGPRDAPFHCLVKRNKKNSTFCLYLTQSQSFTEKGGKFLLAARKYRRGLHSEFIISLDPNDLSQGSKSYVGKIRGNIIGTNYAIYDSQPPHSSAKSSTRGASKRIKSKQISPQVSARNFEVGRVSYKFNLFKSNGPRRMECALTPPSTAQTSNQKTEITNPSNIILKNKSPRWHEQLQCWCLNFHGRVTVASVKNFQLAASEEKGNRETVLLQFGKVSDDTFTMDYRYPLSAFQAFAICLTSFGSKVACE